MSVTTSTFLDEAFRVPLVFHWLRSPVSKSALKMTLAEAEPMSQGTPLHRIQDGMFFITKLLLRDRDARRDRLFHAVRDSTQTGVRFGPLNTVSEARQDRRHHVLVAVCVATGADAQSHHAVDLFLNLMNELNYFFG